MHQQSPAIELKGITLRRGGRALIDRLDWRVPRGACCALLGPNGAGKSTLLAIITGFLWPREGTVDVLGERLGETNLEFLRQRIGVVGHSRLPEFHGELTALETVIAGRWGTIVIPPHRVVAEADVASARRELETVGMLGRAETEFGRLSSGEQMRVLLARAVVAEPELLILDEPTASLDMAGRAAFVGALEDLHARRPELTVVVVTHYVEDLPRSVETVLLLREGRIVGSGPAEQTLTSEMLGRAFGCRVELFQEDGHRWTRVVPQRAWALKG